MSPKTTLQDLPRFDDKLTYLYVEHAVIDQQDHAIAKRRSACSCRIYQHVPAGQWFAQSQANAPQGGPPS